MGEETTRKRERKKEDVRDATVYIRELPYMA
jgi:hypothetical protein